MNIIRSKVHVVANSYGAVHEISEDMRVQVNLKQEDCWWEDNKLITMVRDVWIYVDHMNYKIGDILPGNILRAFTTEQISEDPEEYMYWTERGIARTPEGHPIYMFYCYCPDISYQPHGLLVSDQWIDELSNSSEPD